MALSPLTNLYSSVSPWLGAMIPMSFAFFSDMKCHKIMRSIFFSSALLALADR